MSSDDFLTVLGSMPKFDNDGVLITNSSLGSGGSRRSNGTLSKMVENLQIVSDDETDNGSLFSCWGNMVRLVVGRTLFFVSR